MISNKQRKWMGSIIKTKTSWYRSWLNARSRCLNTNDSSYLSYGEKGIKFLLTKEQCQDLWIRDKGWLLSNPSIDRIDTYGNYEFSNCRFIELTENLKRPRRKI